MIPNSAVKPDEIPHGKLHFAIDTGGTFTDLIVRNPDGSLQMHKAPTTPADPVIGVIEVLRVAATANGQGLAEYVSRGALLVHGTTHAINAVITGRTARTAFITTKGHPDTLVFREGGRQDSFNFTIPYPEPFIPKALTFEADERILADGSIERVLDTAAMVAMLQDIAARKVEAVAVCLLWSIVNPAHELEIGRLIETHLPGVPYTLSHRLNPSIREYRRAMSTCIDASLKPIMGHYMRSLDSRLRAEGFAGRLLVVTSQGGVMDAVDVAEAPVHLLNSGPSMGPIGARAYCDSTRTPTLIVGDTGGTTFDVSLIRGGRIPRTRETWLGRPLVSHLTGMPSVDIKSIGAGGGSIAWVDAGGLLHVGPISAGSDPGPACYARGGARPTVTDASLVLGFLDPENFLGGRMKLRRDLAASAIRAAVAEPLGVDLETAAAAIVELATEHMVQAILDITVNQGVDPKEAAFVAGGGAAGLNCAAIGRRLGCRWVYVPETGAALAASGALVSDLVSHQQAMFHSTSGAFDFGGVAAVLDRLERECHAFHARTGPEAELVGIHWSVEARYPDQAWEIEVPLRSGRLDSKEAVERLVGDFHAAHAEIFAINDPGSEIEVIGWNAAVHCRLGEIRTGRVVNQASANPAARRRIYFRDTGWIDVPVVEFDAVSDGGVLVGPAILESGFTSIVVESGDLVSRDPSGMIVIENSRYGAEA